MQTVSVKYWSWLSAFFVSLLFWVSLLGLVTR
ncbi:small membrane protein YmiC [Citrobacter sp. S2-9]|uniref:Small membrane protein YmiC n=1 Tax=Citrobacter enshiensis TaxID=2971264 RepID=A0ABT8PRN7_9ENTR|nr:small membrane protein YmiC [Citrobacter enshiensis]